MKLVTPNKDIRILQAGKGNCKVVLDESRYNSKLNLLLEYEAYELLLRMPNFCNGENKYKDVQPAGLKHKLTPYHSKPPH